MKYLFLVTILTLVATSCAPKELPTVINVTEEIVEVKLSYLSTKADLDKVVSLAKEKHDITVDYSGTTFFDNNRLRDVSLKVTLPNGKGGKSSVMLAHIEHQYFGFLVDKSPGAISAFRIGTMN